MLLVAFACVTTVVGVFLLMQKPRSKAVVTDGQTMFAADGSYSSSLVSQLSTLVANVDKTAVGTTQRSNAAQIRMANGGAVPQVKLFETIGVTSSSKQSFTERQWRLVYITHPSGGGAPVFTFFMSDPYRNSIFDVAPTHYNSSVIRANLTNDIADILNYFPGVSRNIVTPANLPGAWQSNQPDNAFHENNSITGDALNDKIWLPSTYELDIDSNFWSLSLAERFSSQNSFSDEAWLRSSNGGNANYGVTATNGSADAWYPELAENHAVRPAIHISFPPLVTDTSPLFMASAPHNLALAEQLRTLANAAEKFGVSYVDVGYFEMSDAEQIRNANGGALPTISLFGNPRQHGLDFADQLWRLVYISHGGPAPVFTFMMAEAYSNSEFSYNSYDNYYGHSAVRAKLTGDFDNMLNFFSDASDYIVTPRDLPGSQLNSFDGAAGDLIWLPSVEELSGTWNLKQAECGYLENGHGSSAWTRISHGTGSAETVLSSGEFDLDDIWNVNAVRPAIHITLPLNCPTCNNQPCTCPNDVVAVRKFLLQQNSGITNADKLGIDAYNTGTWVNYFRFNGSNRLTRVGMLNGMLSSNLSRDLHGKIEFPGCTALESILLSGNRFTGIDVSTNISLLNLEIEDNLLTTLDVSNNPALISLIIANNENLTTLNVSNNPALLSLNALYTNLSDVDVTNCPSLTMLIATGTFSSFDTTNNPSLSILFALSENLYSIFTASNPMLEVLAVSGVFPVLDVSDNTLLTALFVSSPYLTTLDVTNNIYLTDLAVNNTGIYDLNLEYNRSLTYLNVSNNNLGSLDLFNNADLSHVNISNNNINNVIMPNHGYMQTFEAYGNPLEAGFINSIIEHVEDSLYAIEYFSYSYDDSLFAVINKNNCIFNAKVLIDIMPYYFFVDITNGSPTQYITVTLGDDESVLKQATNYMTYKADELDINNINIFEEVLRLEEIFSFGLYAYTSAPALYKAEYSTMPVLNDSSLLISFTCDDPCTDPDCPIHNTLGIWNPQLTHSVTNGVYYSHIFAAAVGATEYSLVSGTIPTGLAFSSSLRTLTGIPYAAHGLYTFTIRATVGGVNIDRVITINVAPATLANQYIITESGSIFTAVVLDDMGADSFVGAENSIQDLIHVIRDDANGNDCNIAFRGEYLAPDYYAPLNIGTQNIVFDGTWGTVTISGGITSEIGSSGQATLVINGVTVISNADISNTAVYGSRIAVMLVNGGNFTMTGGMISADSSYGVAIYHNSSGSLTINGGTVTAVGGHGIAIQNESNGFIVIEETSGAIYIVGTAEDRMGTIHLNSGNGICDIISGTIINTSSGTALVTHGPTIYIIGGVIRGGTYTVGIESYGIVNMSGGTVENENSGAFYISSLLGVTLYISGGQITANTAIFCEPSGRYDQILLSGNPIMNGRIETKAGKLAIIPVFNTANRVYDLKILSNDIVDGAIAVNGGTGYLSSFNLVQTSGYTLMDDGTNLVLYINDSPLAPAAPTLSLNATGDTVTITPLIGGEFQWRYAGETAWKDLGTANTFTVTTGITSGRTYEARVRIAAIGGDPASDWSPIGSLVHPTFTITYNRNGGNGTIASQTKYHGTGNPITLSAGTGFSRVGWDLLGWHTNSAATSPVYVLGAQYYNNLELTLFAIWRRTPVTWDWSLVPTTYNITNGIAITPIVIPAATGGNGVFTYPMNVELPAGLTFNEATRTISGTPNVASGTYNILIWAQSLYDSGGVVGSQSLTFIVARGSQVAPTAPGLSLNAAGDTVTISAVSGGEYQWRYIGETAWNDLGATNTFNISTGITAGRGYEARRRLAATVTHNASNWSITTSYAHPTYTITYSNNGGTGTIQNQIKFHGTLNPVVLNDGANFSRPGWRVSTWNTNSSGTGSTYALSSTFSANSSLNLFAVWENIPVSWSLVNTEYHVTIGVAITPIVLPAATGGNDIFTYSVDYLPAGLTFDQATRTISGTPYDAADTYQATAMAQSAYDGDIVSMYRTLTFVVTLNTQVVPTAPTLSLNAPGDVVTISAVSGGEYQWRYAGAGVWTALGTNNTFTVTTGITADRGYEARRRLAATETHAASDWSSIGTLAHPTYTITYNSNGGTGTIASQTKYHGTFNTITFNDGANFSRPGWELIAWNTAANGMGTQYILTAVVGTNANFDLFAVWERIPITWEISSTEYYVTNGITIMDIVLPTATGGNGIITYTATSLPTGLVFDTGTRTISGTPNAAPGKYFVIVSAKSTYNGGTVSSGDIAIEFNVAAGTQTAPAAPSLSFWNPAGNTISISPVGGGSGYEYRWRYAGEIAWNESVSNIFTVTTGITAGRTYQAQVRYAATTTHDASPWSASGTMVHSEYYIRYYSNGGTGTIANQTKYYGTLNPVTLDNGENFSRAGWNLTGWNTNSDESGLPHDLSEQYTANAPLFLYAVWERTPVDWSFDELTYNVTNGVAISSIYFSAATGGDGSFDYTITGLPAGLTFDSQFLTITGVPNEIPGRYYVTATATSTYDDDSVSAVITLVFFVNSGTQDAPSAPTLGISATGASILIAPLIVGGYEYQWRSSTADPWISLGTNNTFTIPTGLTGVSVPRYEVQIRFAATSTHDASLWSVSRTLIHPTYTISYNNNGGTGSISNQTKFHGTLNPVNLGDGANFSRPGWHITGWNTASHGLGDSYALNSSYTANAELNLFAIWSQNSLDWNPQLTHFVTNGVSYSHTFAAADEQFGATDFVYSRISGTIPNGLTFNAATRVLSGIPNTAPGEYTFTIRASMYGINLDRVITITVEAGTQNQPTAPTLSLNSQGYEITILAISGGEYRWRYAGETAWNELGTTNTFVVLSGGLAIGGTYEAQRRLAATSTHTASQWSSTGSLAHPEYTITYNNNGGEGTIANQTKYHGSMNIVILNNGGNFSRNGWNLIGWNTAANGLGQSYALGYAYSADAGFTLYAVWERIPITWSLQDSLNNVTNGTAITDIIFPVATGGNGSIVYAVTGLPNGLSFNAETRTISGTPNVTAGTYDAIATATSTYNGGSVSAFRTITFAVSLGNQGTPTAPTLTLNATGGTVTIATIAGGEYQWRYAGEIAWNSLGTANTFSVTTGITAGRTYEARRRLAPTETQSASEWSPVGSLAHPESIISYHNNDGVGTISAQTKYFGTLNPITLSDGTGFSRPGWTLIEWRSEADGTGSAFPLGSVYTGNIGWTLYAVWERIPIVWMLEDASHNVTNGTAISGITFPLATGGNGTIIYTVTGLPSGLTFNAATRTISGTPDTVPGAHHAIATVMSTYDGGSVSAVRTITFVVALGTQTAPSAPSLTLNAAGDTVTIGAVTGGEYRWRYVGEIIWNELGANNTFTVTTGITAGRTYEAQRRLAANETFAASNWSSATQLVHITFGITYNNNGGSGTISNQTKFHGTLNPVTLSDGFGFSRPGWTLTGWNTNATSTGTPYALGVSYTGNAALTLFAVWSPNSVTWNPQVSHSTLYNSFYTHTFAVATEELGATDFVYSFVSGALPNGMTFNAATRVLSGTPNDALGDYIFTIRASINGIDVDRVITVTVNAATQVAPTAPTLVLNEIGNIVTISTVAGAEYRWRYSGETTWLELGTDNIFIVTSDLTSGRIYEAQRRLAATSTHEASPWSATGSLAHPTYTITYNNNEGTGTIANQTKYHGTSNSVNLNGGGNFTRGGWTLIGWNNAANGTGTPYGLGAQYNANAGLTLFAIWERKPIAWSLVGTTYEVTRDVAITDIVLPAATGGNDTIVYTVTGLPTGLTFNAATRTISGTPNAAAGAYSATATAASTYGGDTVSATRTLIFNVSLASQPTPSAPTLEINASGDIVTITTIAGGEYQWRIAGSSTWTSLGAANTFNIPTGVTSATVYEAQRRLAATGSLAESPWSSVGSTTHQTYIISYNLNGGTGSILNQTKFHGILNPVILRDNANFTRPGWTLTGWNTNAAGTGTAYAINAQYTGNAGISLFAVWTQNPMQWNPVLSLPDGFGGYPYTRALAPLASGIDQTFTYTLYSGSLGGLVLSTSGVITGTLNTVTGTALLQFVVAVTSNNGQSIVSGTFTLTVNTGAPTCPNPCTDPDCPIHGSIKPTLPGAKLEKDEDRITLAGIANPEIYTYSWSFKVGSGSFEMISAGTTQTFVVFVQDEKYKTTYRCQIYFGDDLIKTLEYVIYPPKGPSIFNNPIVTAGLLFIGVIIFVLFLIMLWMQRDRRRNSHVIIGEDNGMHGSGKSGLVGHCDNKPIIPGTGLVGCDKKTRKRRTGLIKD